MNKARSSQRQETDIDELSRTFGFVYSLLFRRVHLLEVYFTLPNYYLDLTC